MSNTEPVREKSRETPRINEMKSFNDVLGSLVGKVVTFVNPESLEDAPMGYQLTTGFYRARILGVQDDFLTVATELLHKGREGKKEPIKQFISLKSVKRISVGRAEILVHI